MAAVAAMNTFCFVILHFLLIQRVKHRIICEAHFLGKPRSKQSHKFLNMLKGSKSEPSTQLPWQQHFDKVSLSE